MVIFVWSMRSRSSSTLFLGLDRARGICDSGAEGLGLSRIRARTRAPVQARVYRFRAQGLGFKVEGLGLGSRVQG